MFLSFKNLVFKAKESDALARSRPNWSALLGKHGTAHLTRVIRISLITFLSALLLISQTGVAFAHTDAANTYPAGHLSLAQAQAAWPDATYSPSGRLSRSGRFIVPNRTNGYALVTVSAHVTKVVAPSAPVFMAAVRPLNQAGCPSNHGYDACGQFGNYQCGTLVSSTINVDAFSAVGTYIAIKTDDTVNVCNWARTDHVTPDCSGFGSCGGSQVGVIGQYGNPVNPYYNVVVQYPGPTSCTYYARQYLYTDTSWNGWLSAC